MTVDSVATRKNAADRLRGGGYCLRTAAYGSSVT
jgi:hypothetical protein